MSSVVVVGINEGLVDGALSEPDALPDADVSDEVNVTVGIVSDPCRAMSAGSGCDAYDDPANVSNAAMNTVRCLVATSALLSMVRDEDELV